MRFYNIVVFLEGDFLAKKKGEQYKCDECGLVVLIETRAIVAKDANWFAATYQ
jgi:hypothetical protein